jgi:uncharacterized membrane protein
MGIIGAFIKRLNPQYIKKMEINRGDERYIQIREKSGYVTFIITMFSMSILELVFLVMDNYAGCILILAAMTVHVASFFIALFYYGKKI